MRAIPWHDLGFSDDEAMELAALQRNPNAFTLENELTLWAQWVRELERGSLWTKEELEAAWAARDNLDLSLKTLIGAEARGRLLNFVDNLDRIFRDSSVQNGMRASQDPSNWWRGRIPLANAPRLYLFEDQ